MIFLLTPANLTVVLECVCARAFARTHTRGRGVVEGGGSGGERQELKVIKKPSDRFIKLLINAHVIVVRDPGFCPHKHTNTNIWKGANNYGTNEIK